MEENDMLSALFQDPKMLEQAISAASTFLSGTSNNSSTTPDTSGYDPSADLIQRAMPVLSRIAQNGQTAVNPQKRALLNAMKPFVHENIRTQIDHGMRLVSLARMATALLSKPQEDGNNV